MSVPRGRDEKRAEFKDLFSKSFRCRVVMSQAFSMLTPYAKTACFIVYIKIDNAKYHKRKLPDGRPVFTFSAIEAQKFFDVSGVTHTAAIRQLIEHGFIELVDHGGLIGANGTASTYTTSKRWEKWTCEKPSRTNVGIKKALENKKLKRLLQKEPVKPALQVSERPELEPGMEIYYYPDNSRVRARKGVLLVECSGGWQIQAKREASKLHAPVVSIPPELILTTEQLEADRKCRNNSYRREARKHASF